MTAENDLGPCHTRAYILHVILGVITTLLNFNSLQIK